MIDRRDVLLKAPLLAAIAMPASAFARQRGADQPKSVSSKSTALSAAVLAAASLNFMTTVAKIHRGILIQNDAMSTIAMLDLLRNHFIEADFDEVFKKSRNKVDPTMIDFTSITFVQNAYEVFHKADETFTLNEVRQTIA